MTGTKSEKELAFLHDLFIASDWGERFAELIDEHVTLPANGRALYFNVGTGGHVMALQERAGDELKFLCVDESYECLELARAKAATAKAAVEFRLIRPDVSDLEGENFDLVIGDASLVAPQQVTSVISELVRVAAPEAVVTFTLPTSSSFGEFFSIYWEALHNSGLIDHESDVERLIVGLPTVSDVEDMAAQEGLKDVRSWTRIEEFDYPSGEEFLNSPLISDFLMNNWLKSLPDDARQTVALEIARLINEERHNAEFSLTLKATLVSGRKADLPLAG